MLAGCPAPTNTAPTEPAVTATPKGPALPVDHPKVDLLTSRETNRLSISQLRGTLAQVFGNDVNGQPITWRVQTQQGVVDGLDAFALTLGEPDYIVVTDENLEPSPLYLKFMGDLARDVCERALAADWAKTDKAQRVLVRYAEKTDTTGVDENLRYLRLRFHGIKVAGGDDAPIASYRSLFSKTVAATGDVREGWRAVCVALTTAPEFHLY
jgi:hypothetical protein